jgi:hypothetical protein
MTNNGADKKVHAPTTFVSRPASTAEQVGPAGTRYACGIPWGLYAIGRLF